jgi:hypothetical protein
MTAMVIRSSGRKGIISIGNQNVTTKPGVKHADGVLEGRSESDAFLTQYIGG